MEIRWDVKRLRRRIFAASRAKNFKKLRDLQYLMVHSLSNIVLTTRRVTIISRGKNTAGIDQKLFITNMQRMDIALEIDNMNLKLWIPHLLKECIYPSPMVEGDHLEFLPSKIELYKV